MIIPIMMIKNEEIWLREVIKPILNVFGILIVGDTGSTDDTLKILRSYSQIEVNPIGSSPREMGVGRRMLAEFAKWKGATHAMMIDGDELYTTRALRYIRDTGLPSGFDAGFTTGLEISQLSTGEFAILGKNGDCIRRNQLAVFPVDAVWKGEYPFESPDVFRPDAVNYYYDNHTLAFRHATHHYHLHQCQRSSKDEETYMRARKRNLYSMQPDPDILPQTIWLKSKDEYEDEM